MRPDPWDAAALRGLDLLLLAAAYWPSDGFHRGGFPHQEALPAAETPDIAVVYAQYSPADTASSGAV